MILDKKLAQFIKLGDELGFEVRPAIKKKADIE